MFLGIVVVVAGLYVLLIAAGVLHRGLLKKGEDGPRRMGMLVFGLGMLIVGLYAVHHAYTLHVNRSNPNFRPADRFGRPMVPAQPRRGNQPLFPPRSGQLPPRSGQLPPASKP